MTAAGLGQLSACQSFSNDLPAQQHLSPKLTDPPVFERVPTDSAPPFSDDSFLPSPPIMPPATATSDVLAPPPPPACPNLSWQFIWSFFVRAPRVRAWLFDKSPPPLSHVAQALLSSPVLCGYVFGRLDRAISQHCFPDIGEMHTTFCRDGDALLGFHFGFNGVQPILPMLFSVARDPMLGNPRVVVRRTALERVHLPDMPPCYVAIEFNWLESGALAVSTCTHPIDFNTANPSGMAAFFDHAEYRVFDHIAASRLNSIAQRLDAAVVHAYFPSQENHFRTPPQDFLDPPDDYICLSIKEPDDPVYHSCLSPAPIPSRTNANSRSNPNQHDETPMREQQSNLSASFDTDAGLVGEDRQPLFNAIAGSTLHADCGESPSIAERGTIVRWKHFQDVVATARRTGMLKTLVSRKVGGLFAKVETLYSRTAGYTFLSTTGVSVHGRIQRLCQQLGIQHSSPGVDAPLLGAAARGEVATALAAVPQAAPEISQGECEVDITNTLVEQNVWRHGGSSAVGEPASISTKLEPITERVVPQPSPGRFEHSVSTAKEQQKVISVPETRPRSRNSTGDEGPRAKRPRVEGVKVESGRRNRGSSSSSAAGGTSSGTNSTQVASTSVRTSPTSERTVVGKGNKAVWTCDQCGVQIRGKKGNLNRHIANKHDNIRAHICKVPLCGRRFQTRLNLVRHERAVHEGRPFACSQCPRAFKVEADLNAHLSSAHADSTVQLACDVCGSCFARRSTLNRHKLRVHKQK